MFTKVLRMIYGNGTRSVQTINLCSNLVWFALLTLPLLNAVSIDIPARLESQAYYPHLLTGLAIMFAFIGFSSRRDRRQLFKVAGLIFGSLTQAIISSFYISAYPPFEPMLIVCSLLSIWFLGAVLYIAYVEGMDGKFRGD